MGSVVTLMGPDRRRYVCVLVIMIVCVCDNTGWLLWSHRGGAGTFLLLWTPALSVGAVGTGVNPGPSCWL